MRNARSLQLESVEGRFAGRTGFPSPENPEPLAGVFADRLLDGALDSLGIAPHVPGNLNRRIEAQDVPPLLVRPEGEAGNDRCAAVCRDPCEARGGAGGDTKHVYED